MMSVLADIFSGETDAADVFFLIATILAVLAAVLYLLPARTSEVDRGPRPMTYCAALVALCLAAGFFGLLLL